ncbi:MAG: hypothetical protein Q8K14_15810, partial [Hydrogenophaga sp.]
EADDLLDIGSVDSVMGMAAWIGFDARALRMPATFTHAAGLNAASPDSILAFKNAIAQFLKPPSKL